MPGTNTGEIGTAAQLPLSISRYIEQLLRKPTDFGPTQRAFQGQYSHPSLQLGSNGAFMDPQQTNMSLATGYAGERGQIAQTDLANKKRLAGELTQAGSNYASLVSTIPYLQASNISSGGGLFSSLGF